HLHIHPLRVHVLEALFRCEAQFGALDGKTFAVTDDSSQPGSWLIAAAVPGLSSVNGLPETLRHQMGMNVDTAHSVLLYDSHHCAGHPLSIREFSLGLNGRKA